jgi:hypothetical protein
VIILGLVLLIVGYGLSLGIVFYLGVILLVLGAVLLAAGALGRPVGGRRWY